MNDWDPVFEKISLDNRHSMSLNDEFNTSDALKNTLSDSSKIELITGISQDRSKVNLTRKQVQLDFDIYKFKGEENKVQIMISYFLPLPEIFKELPSDAKLISFLSGYDFYDQDWNLITGKHDSIVFNRETDGIRPKVKFLSFEVETGKLNGNIYCNPIGEGISCFSKSMIDIPGYTTTGLCASDLMISVVDFKATGNGKKWDKYYLLPSPTNRWSLRKPINLYYEIYNLKKNQEGKTLFRLEYAFRYKGSNENLLKKIFGQENNEVVSTEYTKSGQTAVSNEFIAFDLNRLTPGSYIMEITVKDMNADKNITLKKEVELF
jgi:hypothetical protein